MNVIFSTIAYLLFCDYLCPGSRDGPSKLFFLRLILGPLLGSRINSMSSHEDSVSSIAA
jgi:hypothetical protein